jgi:hypothetical protein
MWLDLQQGQDAPMELRAAAEQAYLTHQNFDVQLRLPQAVNEGSVAGVGQAAAQAPSALGQMALQNAQGGSEPDQAAQHQHEAEQAAHDRELEATTHVSDQQHEAALKQMEIQGQENITRLQGENAVKSAKVAGENAVKVARARPKPKVAA